MNKYFNMVFPNIKFPTNEIKYESKYIILTPLRFPFKLIILLIKGIISDCKQ